MTDALIALVSSALGFVLGYATCLAVRRAVEAEHSVDPKTRRAADLLRTLFGILLLVMATATFVQGYQASTCFREALETRSAAQGQLTQAQLGEIHAQRRLLTTPDGIDRAVIDQYLQSLEVQEQSLLELERARAANPYRCD